MKEIGLWGGQGTNPPPGPKKSGVVAYCLVSVPHRGQVLTSPVLLRVPHFRCVSFATDTSGVVSGRFPLGLECGRSAFAAFMNALNSSTAC